ncbi:MAG: noncanonical pyrimidine nucleotidase, YjjG family [Lachnospiraceae bacterium]|nr:noncanonical pyrimidine nucleotidase, YjjG family [Lachnospiraceae bacterium]
MRKYTTVFWDLDQTLLDFDRSMEYALQAVFAQYGLKINEEMTARYSVINRSYWLRLESGELSKEQVTVGRFRTFFEELGITHVSPEELNVDYQRELGSVFFFMEGAKELVALLKERGYRQYVVTNGVNATQANKMRLSGLDRIMDGVFVSELMGYPKPRKEFFDGCFAALSDVDRNKCILVGDSLTSDMRGAENAGIASCWFNPEKQEKDVDVRTDYEIRRLEELISILEQE